VSTAGLILNLEKARQTVLSDVRREQVRTIVALAFPVVAIYMLLAAGTIAGFLSRRTDGSLLPLDQTAASPALVVAIAIVFAGWLSCVLLVGIIIYDSLQPYNHRFPLLHETARWLRLILVAPAGIIFPPIILGPWIMLQCRFAYQGRFQLALALDLLAGHAVRMSSACTKNLITAHRAEVHFHAGNYEKGLAMARSVSSAATTAYNAEAVAGNLHALIVVGSTHAALCGLQGLQSEGETVLEGLLALRARADDLMPVRRAEAFSYLAYACIHLGKSEQALELSELAAESLEKSNADHPPLAGCIAEHWALAALDRGNLDCAEEQALAIQKHWRAITDKTAERQADSYFVLGQVALASGQMEEASEQLSLAIAIRQIRNGKNHPELRKYESRCILNR
jgi:tetratricopeptide (TPR) repeat protein